MSSLGSYLSGLRERRGLSREELARSTRVASRYIEALESESFDRLPAPVFAKGFIRAYCQVLGVPPDEALARYGECIGEPSSPPAEPVSRPQPSDQPARSRGTVLLSFVLLVVLGLTLFAVTILLQSGRTSGPERRAQSSTSETPESASPAAQAPAPAVAVDAPPAAAVATPPAAVATPPAAVASPAPVALPAPVPSSAPAARTLPAAPPAEPAARPVVAESRQTATVSAGELASLASGMTPPYRLVARFSELTWLRVRMDDGRFTEETIPAGQVREWVSNGPFVLTVGNAGGVTLELNGRTLPPLGAKGAVISRLVIPPAQQ